MDFVHPQCAALPCEVDKYYTGPDSNPTGYPLPELSKDDPDHAPAVDVKAGTLASGCVGMSLNADTFPKWAVSFWFPLQG